MYVRPRLRVRPRNGGILAFSPASLFTSGVQGAWYDPSDYSTLFQDSAGTTPVTAVEQPVGLMLDKSQGATPGSELITNGDFATGTDWTLGSGCAISGGKLVATSVATNSAASNQSGRSFSAGKFYLIEYDYAMTAGILYVNFGSLTTFSAAMAGTSGHYKAIIATTSSATNFYIGAWASAGTTSGTIDNISVKELPGNHASQATTASRPVLRARYNLLTYSEQFDNAAWSKTGMLAFGSGSVVNATTAPNDTTTADLLTPDTSSSTKAIRLIVTSAGANTWSFYAKANGYTKVGVWDYATSGAFAAFLLSGSGSVLDSGSGASNVTIISVGNGWYRCSFTATVTGSLGFSLQVLSPSYTPGSINAAWAANGTDGIYFWGADLRTGSSAGTYQRIAAATDYATAGFLPYLAFDGTDDSMVTNTITPGIDKTQVFVGVSKLSDAVTGMLVEFSAGSGSGRFETFAPIGAGAQNYYFSTGGTSFASNTVTTYAAPITNVFTGIGDIGADVSVIRINGAQVASNSANQGTGDYLAYPLYIGRRGGTSVPFNGRIYQLIVRFGTSLSASELASTESFVAAKTGVAI